MEVVLQVKLNICILYTQFHSHLVALDLQQLAIKASQSIIILFIRLVLIVIPYRHPLQQSLRRYLLILRI